MRERGLIPLQSKSVQHEARNGVLLCWNHHGAFVRHSFYIRWVPVVRFHSLHRSPYYYLVLTWGPLLLSPDSLSSSIILEAKKWKNTMVVQSDYSQTTH